MGVFESMPNNIGSSVYTDRTFAKNENLSKNNHPAIPSIKSDAPKASITPSQPKAKSTGPKKSHSGNKIWEGIKKAAPEVLKTGVLVGASVLGGVVAGPIGAITAGASISTLVSAVDQKRKTGKIDLRKVAIDGALGAIPGGSAKIASKIGGKVAERFGTEALKNITAQGGKQAFKTAAIIGASDGAAIGALSGSITNAYDSHKATGKINLGNALKSGAIGAGFGAAGGAVLGGGAGVLGSKLAKTKSQSSVESTQSEELSPVKLTQSLEETATPTQSDSVSFTTLESQSPTTPKASSDEGASKSTGKVEKSSPSIRDEDLIHLIDPKTKKNIPLVVQRTEKTLDNGIKTVFYNFAEQTGTRPKLSNLISENGGNAQLTVLSPDVIKNHPKYQEAVKSRSQNPTLFDDASLGPTKPEKVIRQMNSYDGIPTDTPIGQVTLRADTAGSSPGIQQRVDALAVQKAIEESQANGFSGRVTRIETTPSSIRNAYNLGFRPMKSNPAHDEIIKTLETDGKIPLVKGGLRMYLPEESIPDSLAKVSKLLESGAASNIKPMSRPAFSNMDEIRFKDNEMVLRSDDALEAPDVRIRQVSQENASVPSRSGSEVTLLDVRQGIKNGTVTVNRELATSTRQLHPNDEVRIGNTTYEYTGKGLHRISQQADNFERLFPSTLGKSHLMQGGIGNCYFVASIDALSHHPLGRKILGEAIKIQPDGSAKVTFLGYPDTPISIPKGTLQHLSFAAHTSPEARGKITSAAAIVRRASATQGTPQSYLLPNSRLPKAADSIVKAAEAKAGKPSPQLQKIVQNIKKQDITQSEKKALLAAAEFYIGPTSLVKGDVGHHVLEYAFAELLKRKSTTNKIQAQLQVAPKTNLTDGGGVPTDVLYALTGGNIHKVVRTTPGKDNMPESFTQTLEELAGKTKEVVITAGTKAKDKTSGDTKVWEPNVNAQHAYRVSHIDPENRTVTIVNPHDTTKKTVTLDFERFDKYFNQIDTVNLST